MYGDLWDGLPSREAASSKRPDLQQHRSKEPMRAGIKPAQQKHPTADQKRIRRQMTRQAAFGGPVSIWGTEYVSVDDIEERLHAINDDIGAWGVSDDRVSEGQALQNVLNELDRAASLKTADRTVYCPECGGPLVGSYEEVQCDKCGREYSPLNDGYTVLGLEGEEVFRIGVGGILKAVEYAIPSGPAMASKSAGAGIGTDLGNGHTRLPDGRVSCPSADKTYTPRQTSDGPVCPNCSKSLSTSTKESTTMTAQPTTEADLVARMAAATSLSDLTSAQMALEEFRSTRRESVAQSDSFDWTSMGDLPPTREQQMLAHLTTGDLPPATASVRLGHTEATDFLDDLTPSATEDHVMGATVRAEATRWYEGVWSPVKADPSEFSSQAKNAAVRTGTFYGLQAAAATSVFLDTVRHLASREGISTTALEETVDTYVSDGKTTLPVGVESGSTDTMDEWGLGADNNASSDPKSTTDRGDAPSLSEGTSPEGDKSEGVDNPNYGDGPDKSTWDVGSTEDKMLTQKGSARRTAGEVPESFKQNWNKKDGEGDDDSKSDDDSGKPWLNDDGSKKSSSMFDQFRNDSLTFDAHSVTAITEGTEDTCHCGKPIQFFEGSWYHLSKDGPVDWKSHGPQTHPDTPKEKADKAKQSGLQYRADNSPNSTDGLGEGIDEGSTPEGDHAESPVQEPGQGAADKSSGGNDPDSIGTGGTDGSNAAASQEGAYTSSLIPLPTIAAAFRGRQVSESTRTLAAGLERCASLEHEVGGVSARTMVAHLLAAPEVPTAVKLALNAHLRMQAEGEGGQTCSVCGDSITKDPAGENPSTWHHDNGTSHDHEAKPGGGESKEGQRAPFARESKTETPSTDRYRKVFPNGVPNREDLSEEQKAYLKGGSLTVSARSTCDICMYEEGREGQPAYWDGKTVHGPWAHMCDRHFKSHGVGEGPFGKRLKEASKTAESEWGKNHPGKERCPKTEQVKGGDLDSQRYQRCSLEKGHYPETEHQYDGPSVPAPTASKTGVSLYQQAGPGGDVTDVERGNPNYFRVEFIADDTDQWYSNSIVFASAEVAEQAGQAKANSWFSVVDWRVVPDDTPMKQHRSDTGHGKWASKRKTGVSVTNVGIDSDGNGTGTANGTQIKFRLTDKERSDLKAVLYSDMAMNFSGVDIEQSDIIKDASRKTATYYCTTHQVYVGDGNRDTHSRDSCNVEQREKKDSAKGDIVDDAFRGTETAYRAGLIDANAPLNEALLDFSTRVQAGLGAVRPFAREAAGQQTIKAKDLKKGDRIHLDSQPPVPLEVVSNPRRKRIGGEEKVEVDVLITGRSGESQRRQFSPEKNLSITRFGAKQGGWGAGGDDPYGGAPMGRYALACGDEVAARLFQAGTEARAVCPTHGAQKVVQALGTTARQYGACLHCGAREGNPDWYNPCPTSPDGKHHDSDDDALESGDALMAPYDYGYMLGSRKTAGWLDSARKVLDGKSFVSVDPGHGGEVETEWQGDEISPDAQGVVLDMTTAHMLVTVHDALNETNAAKFAALPLMKAVDMGWSLVSKTKSR